MLLEHACFLLIITCVSTSKLIPPVLENQLQNELNQTIYYKVITIIFESPDGNHSFYTSFHLEDLEDFETFKTLLKKNEIYYHSKDLSQIVVSENDAKYLINFTYVGKFEKNSNGFFEKDNDKGKIVWILSNNHEVIYTIIIPYLNDPYTSKSAIKISHPKHYSTVSTSHIEKTEIDRRNPNNNITTYIRASENSTDMIGFIPAGYSCSEGIITKEKNVSFWICSRDKVASFRQFAIDNVPKLISSLEEYTGIEYGSLKIGKVYLLAIPNFSGSVTAYPGLLIFRESDLLCEVAECAKYQKQKVLIKIALGLSEFWFGNLVSTDWWYNTFLSKALAIHLGYQIPHELDSSLELDKQFVVDVMHKILVSDTPMRAVVLSDDASRNKIEEKFYQTFLYKGASIFRMFQNIIQLDNFKQSIQKFLKRCQMSTTTTREDFLQSLDHFQSKHHVKMDQMMLSWITRPGYPIVNVKTENSKTIFIEGKNFRNENDSLEKPPLANRILATSQKLEIPLTLATSDNPILEPTVKYWLPPDSDYSPHPEDGVDGWTVVNYQQIGYYRVNYETSLWEKINTALSKRSFDDIDEMNRAQIIDDYFNFAVLGYRTVPEFLQICKFLKNDVSYYSWKAAFNAFFQIFDIISDDQTRSKFVNYILPLLKAVYNSVSFEATEDQNHMDVLMRELVMSNACNLGVEDCIDNAVAAFGNYINMKKKPEKNLRHVVYCNGLRYSNNLKIHWNFLWQKLKNEEVEEERNTILMSLGCVTDKKTLNNYLKRIITEDSEIKSSEALLVFWSVLSGSYDGFEVAFDFLKNNYDAVTEYFSSLNSLNSLFKLLSSKITNEERFEKWMYFVKELQPGEFHLSFYEVDLNRNFLYRLEQVFAS